MAVTVRAVTTGVPEAPLDCTLYGRESAQWLPSVPLAGGTMSGHLILSGLPPASPLEAVTKAYVDSAIIDDGVY